MDNINFEQRLREHGFRVTPQRSVIIKAIWDNGEHATIDEILADVRKSTPSMSPATVYRTIDLFIKHNLVIATTIGNQTVYEIMGDSPHYHLICRTCKWDQKVELKQIKTLIEDINQEYDFLVSPGHMVLMGECAHCREQSSPESK